MRTQRLHPKTAPRGGVSVSKLVELVRHRRQRSRNRAELMTLDAAGLQDIGLSHEGRTRIICRM